VSEPRPQSRLIGEGVGRRRLLIVLHIGVVGVSQA
jgi:hypothetical protein